MDPSEKQAALFVQLTLMLHAGAMQHMGKIKNPMTNTVERELPAAQGMIDMLEMLRVRTQGNLSPDEAKMLDQILQELRLNFVDEVNKPDPPKTGGAPAS